MPEETLLTAARRLVRFVRVDDQAHGGLLSRDTIVAADTLNKQILLHELIDERKLSVEDTSGEGDGRA